MSRLTATLLALAACTSAASATEWPHHAKGAVVLTYDDAIASQLDHAIPALDRARLKATFFLSNVQQSHVFRWRAVARSGHELANHTLFHPCAAATYPADPRYTTEAYTPASMIREIAQQETLLTALDGKAKHGFGTPCGGTTAGGRDYIAPLRATNFVSYMRGEPAKPGDTSTDVSTIDPMRIPARDFPECVTGAQLIAFAQAAQDGGGMAVFVFHGVGGDYLQVSDAAHRELVDWLAKHRREIWVAPLGEVIDWARRNPGKPAGHPSR